MNPQDFEPGDIVVNIYTNIRFEIVRHIRGMSILKNLRTGHDVQLNGCNNPHYEKAAE